MIIATNLLSNIFESTLCAMKIKNWLKLKADCKYKKLASDFRTNATVTYLFKTSWKETFDSDISFQFNELLMNFEIFNFKIFNIQTIFEIVIELVFKTNIFFLESKSEDCFTFCEGNIKKGGKFG